MERGGYLDGKTTTVVHEQQNLKAFWCVSPLLVQYNEIIFAITAMQLEIGY